MAKTPVSPGSSATLVMSAIALLPPSVKDDLLFKLAAKDATLGARLLELGGENLDCHCISLEDGVIGTYKQAVVWMSKILTQDEKLTKLEGESRSKEAQYGITKALEIVRERCKGLGLKQRTRLVKQFNEDFSHSAGFDRVFSGFLEDNVPITVTAAISPTLPGALPTKATPPLLPQPIPAKSIHPSLPEPPPALAISSRSPSPDPISNPSGPRSSALLLSLPTEVIRLVFNLGAKSFSEIPAWDASHCALQERYSYLKSASLVHSRWRGQAQAELVCIARCAGVAPLLSLANFLEQSKQVQLLRSLTLAFEDEDPLEKSDLSLTEIAGGSTRYTTTKGPHPTPFWFAAKRLVDLGVHLDTLRLCDLPGPLAWSFLKQSESLALYLKLTRISAESTILKLVPTRTLHLAGINIHDGYDYTLDAIAPHTTRLVMTSCETEDDGPPIFHGPSAITELVLRGNNFCAGDDAEPADLSLFWAPLIPTVTSICFELCNFYTSRLRLHRLHNISKISFLPYDPPEYEDPKNLPLQVSLMIGEFPNLRHFVLPSKDSWDLVESIFRRIAGPEILVSRQDNPGELTDEGMEGVGPTHSYADGYDSCCEDDA